MSWSSVGHSAALGRGSCTRMGTASSREVRQGQQGQLPSHTARTTRKMLREAMEMLGEAENFP